MQSLLFALSATLAFLVIGCSSGQKDCSGDFGFKRYSKNGCNRKPQSDGNNSKERAVNGYRRINNTQTGRRNSDNR